MKIHYSTEELELYRHGKLSVLGAIRCRAHLKNCPECRRALAQLDDDDALISELRQSVEFHREFSAPPPAPSSARRQ